MVLPQTLIDEIRKITDAQWTGHEGWPTNFLDSAQRWVNAFDVYMQPVVPVSTTRAAAVIAALATPPGIATTFIPLAWKNYTVALAVGMAPGFIAVPPVGVIPIASVTALGLSGASALDCATELARITTIWIKTGLATPVPSGPIITWS